MNLIHLILSQVPDADSFAHGGGIVGYVVAGILLTEKVSARFGRNGNGKNGHDILILAKLDRIAELLAELNGRMKG